MIWKALAVGFLLSVLIYGSTLVQAPYGVEPIQSFCAAQYMGQWYEIARLENRFERGLVYARAHYTLRKDGGIDVVNQGFDPHTRAWYTARGTAYSVQGTEVGHLKVSFFWPLYGAYVIFFLDPACRYACVAGSTRAYLWFLARTPQVSEKVKKEMCAQAEAKGFDVTQLVWADQDAPYAVEGAAKSAKK